MEWILKLKQEREEKFPQNQERQGDKKEWREGDVIILAGNHDFGFATFVASSPFSPVSGLLFLFPFLWKYFFLMSGNVRERNGFHQKPCVYHRVLPPPCRWWDALPRTKVFFYLSSSSSSSSSYLQLLFALITGGEGPKPIVQDQPLSLMTPNLNLQKKQQRQFNCECSRSSFSPSSSLFLPLPFRSLLSTAAFWKILIGSMILRSHGGPSA